MNCLPLWQVDSEALFGGLRHARRVDQYTMRLLPARVHTVLQIKTVFRFHIVCCCVQSKDMTFQFFTATNGAISAGSGNFALKRTSFLNNKATVYGPITCQAATMILDEVGWLA